MLFDKVDDEEEDDVDKEVEDVDVAVAVVFTAVVAEATAAVAAVGVVLIVALFLNSCGFIDSQSCRNMLSVGCVSELQSLFNHLIPASICSAGHPNATRHGSIGSVFCVRHSAIVGAFPQSKADTISARL